MTVLKRGGGRGGGKGTSGIHGLQEEYDSEYAGLPIWQLFEDISRSSLPRERLEIPINNPIFIPAGPCLRTVFSGKDREGLLKQEPDPK